LFDLHVLSSGMEVAGDGVPGGRRSATAVAFAKDLTGHGGAAERISDTSSDMSQAFIAGIGAHLPNATLTFDR